MIFGRTLAFGAVSLLLACAPKTRTVGNLRVPIQEEEDARAIERACRGNERCLRVCEDARQDPGYQAACDEAQAEASPGTARPVVARRSRPARATAESEASEDDAVLRDAHAVWGPGSLRNSRPLPPAGLFARAMSGVVVVRTPAGLGSGFAVHGSGVIVTNLHVVRGESDIDVVFWNGAKAKVRRIEGYDDRHDLAVLRVKTQVNTLALSPEDDLIPGEPIVAIGNPAGLQLTITEGVVSGLRIKDDETRVVQISAAISPGSSGGPVLNQWGEVVAVATFKFVKGESLNFAMPTRYVRSLLRTLKPMSLADFAAATKASPSEEPSVGR
jgi:S1-C subfamily serine protease